MRTALPPLLTALGCSVTLSMTGCPAAPCEASKATATRPATPEPELVPAPQRQSGLLGGTAFEDATPEERRLSVKIAALEKLRAEMRTVLDALPAEKAAAQTLEKRLEEVRGRLSNDEVASILKQTHAEVEARLDAAPEGSLLARARGIDRQLDALIAKEEPSSDDAENVQQLKVELTRQQKATRGMAAATRVAFRALSVIERMKLALPRLEAALAKPD